MRVQARVRAIPLLVWRPGVRVHGPVCGQRASIVYLHHPQKISTQGFRDAMSQPYTPAPGLAPGCRAMATPRGIERQMGRLALWYKNQGLRKLVDLASQGV